jgi:hypothetical protein
MVIYVASNGLLGEWWLCGFGVYLSNEGFKLEAIIRLPLFSHMKPVLVGSMKRTLEGFNKFIF